MAGDTIVMAKQSRRVLTVIHSDRLRNRLLRVTVVLLSVVHSNGHAQSSKPTTVARTPTSQKEAMHCVLPASVHEMPEISRYCCASESQLKEMSNETRFPNHRPGPRLRRLARTNHGVARNPHLPWPHAQRTLVVCRFLGKGTRRLKDGHLLRLSYDSLKKNLLRSEGRNDTKSHSPAKTSKDSFKQRHPNFLPLTVPQKHSSRFQPKTAPS